ncbi:MAG: hypothetical protein N4A53_01630 [Pelagimonas sp.]|nr:hypothetical protein [Pelagimonas sp.]
MNGILDLLLSPWGIAAYATFWILKILFGAWAINKALVLLPVPVRTKVETGLSRLKLRRVRDGA